MENLGRSRETTRKIVAPAAARLAGAASRPNAPGGGPLGNRVRERVVSGFQDARRRLVERDRRSRRRPVICGRRRVSPKRAANRLSADGWKTQSRRLGSAFSAFPSDRIPIRHFCSRARQKNIPRTRGGNAFPRSPVSGPGGRRGSEWSSRCRRCLSERARRSRGHFPVVRSRRDPASGPLARVRDLAATLVQFGGDATHPASSARVSC